MLTNISWGSFIAFTTLLMIVYYLYIGVRYYSKELLRLFSFKKRFPNHSALMKSDVKIDNDTISHNQEIQPESLTSHNKYMPLREDTDDTFPQVKKLTVGLKEVIAEAVSNKYIKEEFILSLQLLLKKHQYLKGSPHLAVINNLIASECEKYGYIQLSAEEQVMLWNE